MLDTLIEFVKDHYFITLFITVSLVIIYKTLAAPIWVTGIKDKNNRLVILTYHSTMLEAKNACLPGQFFGCCKNTWPIVPTYEMDFVSVFWNEDTDENY